MVRDTVIKCIIAQCIYEQDDSYFYVSQFDCSHWLRYDIFQVEGNESEALNDSYLELYELLGRDAMLKIFKHFHGDKIDCPMRLYRPEFIADLAENEPDRKKRAKIARAGGYSVRVIEGILSKRRKGNETE